MGVVAVRVRGGREDNEVVTVKMGSMEDLEGESMCNFFQVKIEVSTS
jgi:hypothetical protein